MPSKIAEIGEANDPMATMIELPPQTELPQPMADMKPIEYAPAATPSGEGHKDPANLGTGALSGSESSAGQTLYGIHLRNARTGTDSGEGQTRRGAQNAIALAGSLAIETRRYVDLRRAKARLDLQVKAMCRYACDGDTKAGQKLYAEIAKAPKSALAIDVAGMAVPYFKAMEPLDHAIEGIAKTIAKLGRQAPEWYWAASVSGLSDRFLGLVIGELGATPGQFKSVSAVWKRMGLAVMSDGRQRRVTGDAALEHGYVARRRSLMWNIGESMIKQQVRKAPEDGLPGSNASDDDQARVAIGPYGEIYLERKAFELTRVESRAHAHNRAKRYMEKRLLRELWKASRAAMVGK